MKLIKDIQNSLERETTIGILLMLVGILLFSPLFVSVNDLMTRSVMRTQLYSWVKEYIVPVQMRAVAVVLYPLGLQPVILEEYLEIGKEEKMLIEIAWNCVGWQSVVLFVISCIIALKADKYTLWSKVQVCVFGFLGTILMNIFRIATIIWLAWNTNSWVARFVHDYGSNLLIIFWLFFVWWFAYKYLLEQKTPQE